MAEVTIDSLTKRFGKTDAVKDLSFVIEEQELIVLVGPSGCGKTTTLNCIAGLEQPTSGRIYFDGVDVTDVPPHKRNIAMVFQSSLLYPHLTGRKNIEMSLRKSNLDQAEINRRVEKVARIVNIFPLLDKLPAHVSGGERQRVAIAKAIVREPSVFLMDEPLANLDAALRETLRGEISVLQKDIQTTMVLVTHDQVEAMTMGDRVAVMCDGELLQIGTPNEVYHHPANTFVAQFIGSPPMHLFEGAVTRRDGEPLFESERVKVPLSERHVRALSAAGPNILLGARPQHMHIDAEAAPHSFRAQVYTVEELGKEAIVTVTDESGDKIKIYTPPQVRWQRGDDVWISLDGEHVLLFDADTGSALAHRENTGGGG
jgi:ABC-type sugar transport system ATPase subunit